MGADFGKMRDAARRERQLTIDPRHEELPHGDFPYLDVAALRDLERDSNYHFVNIVLAILTAFIIASAAIFIFMAISMAAPHKAHARDLDGKYADNPLKPWFDGLASKKGLCCSFADGQTVEEADWDTKDGHYRVYFAGVKISGIDIPDGWIVVPDEAVVTEPNKYGKAVVWPYLQWADGSAHAAIRCFIPGAGT